MVDMSISGICTVPTPLTHATISTPYLATRPDGSNCVRHANQSGQSADATHFIESHFSAIAPAATRPMVSRALERPPPLDDRKPYFSR